MTNILKIINDETMNIKSEAIQVVNMPSTFKIVIIGAGIQGCMLALKVSKEFPEAAIDLYETESDILKKTSANNAFRISPGAHYMGPTAKHILKNSILFLRENAGEDVTKSWQTKYVVKEDSHFSLEEVTKHFGKIQKAYKELVDEDIKNKVFGEPENIIQQIDTDSDASFLVEERFIDFPKFKASILKKLEGCKNVKIHCNSEVENPRFSGEGLGYEFNVKQNLEDGTIKNTLHETDVILNCTWDRIDQLDKELHGSVFPEVTYRLKLLIDVQLPEEYKNHNPEFHCFGPFSAVTNKDNGVFAISYEPETNIEQVEGKGAELTEWMKRLLKKDPNDKEAQDFIEEKAAKILEGATKDIPWLKEANIIGYSLGVVKTFGKVDIKNPDSKHHSRTETGVEGKTLGCVDVSAMKLGNSVHNAKLAIKEIRKHEDFKCKLQVFASNMLENTFIRKAPVEKIKPALIFQRYFLPDTAGSSTEENQERENFNEFQKQLHKHAINKTKLNRQITNPKNKRIFSFGGRSKSSSNLFFRELCKDKQTELNRRESVPELSTYEFR